MNTVQRWWLLNIGYTIGVVFNMLYFIVKRTLKWREATTKEIILKISPELKGMSFWIGTAQ